MKTPGDSGEYSYGFYHPLSFCVLGVFAVVGHATTSPAATTVFSNREIPVELRSVCAVSDPGLADDTLKSGAGFVPWRKWFDYCTVVTATSSVCHRDNPHFTIKHLSQCKLKTLEALLELKTVTYGPC